jgi:putative flavoprotein involved in K+ transport
MSTRRIDTLVIGGGQAGLVTSYQFSRRGIPHLVIEQSDKPASHWHDKVWDSFTLVTPNWTLQIPGAEYAGDDPQGFMAGRDVAALFRDYVQRHQLPVQYNTRALSVRALAGASAQGPREHEGFEVQTTQGCFIARQVVIATGLFQMPRIPDYAACIPAHIQQVHSSAYKNPAQLQAGAVLVVGSSQSGAQIADELHRSGRDVFLCVGKSGRAPRRYRGKDGSEWLDLLGISDQTVDLLPSPKVKFAGNPHIVGRSDGRALNLHLFAREGMTLLGTLQGFAGGRLQLAADLHENLAVADEFERAFTRRIDHHIDTHQLVCPNQSLPQWQDGYNSHLLTELDPVAHGITAIVWAAGYRFDFSLLDCPGIALFDEDGYPVQQRGVAAQPGLYFIGLPWLHKQRSGLLSGVGADAAYIVDHMAALREAAPADSPLAA